MKTRPYPTCEESESGWLLAFSYPPGTRPVTNPSRYSF